MDHFLFGNGGVAFFFWFLNNHVNSQDEEDDAEDQNEQSQRLRWLEQGINAAYDQDDGYDQMTILISGTGALPFADLIGAAYDQAEADDDGSDPWKDKQDDSGYNGDG